MSQFIELNVCREERDILEKHKFFFFIKRASFHYIYCTLKLEI